MSTNLVQDRIFQQGKCVTFRVLREIAVEIKLSSVAFNLDHNGIFITFPDYWHFGIVIENKSESKRKWGVSRTQNMLRPKDNQLSNPWMVNILHDAGLGLCRSTMFMELTTFEVSNTTFTAWARIHRIQCGGGWFDHHTQSRRFLLYVGLFWSIPLKI